jgi:hypothetical protein
MSIRQNTASEFSKKPPRYIESITSDQFYKRFKQVRRGAIQTREQTRERSLEYISRNTISQEGSKRFVDIPDRACSALGEIEFLPERVIIDIKGPKSVYFNSIDNDRRISRHTESRVEKSLNFVKVKKLKNKKKIEKIISNI